jgi:2-oxo-4-hydroxy-4-carboxy-5-ureidoimidazoline decarboxylase
VRVPTDRDTFVATFGTIFEHSPWIAAEAFDRGPFRDAAHLHAEMCAVVRDAGAARQLVLIRAHPDLTGRIAEWRELSAESAREQASTGLDRLSEPELEELRRLNETYRARFDFPFILCARLNTPETLRVSLRERLTHSREQELAAALAEIEKIAWLRLQDAVGS